MLAWLVDRDPQTHDRARATRAAQSLPRPTMATARRTHPNPLPAPEICGPLNQPSPSASSQQLPRPDQQTRPVRPETTSGVLREHAWSVFRAAGRGWARSRAGGACWLSRLDGRRAGSMVADLPVPALHPLQRSRSSRRSRLTRLRTCRTGQEPSVQQTAARLGRAGQASGRKARIEQV